MGEMRCAIYARYSSDLQRDRSIEDQIRNCRRHADQNGWLVLSGHIYSDRAMSGASTLGRNGLERLLREAETSPRPFDYVLIDDTSRLSRKMGEVSTIVERLRFHGIHVYFVSQGIDSRDKQSHLSVGVNSLIDSQYRRDLATKTLRGMTGQVRRGFSVGGRVYGYGYVKELDPSGVTDRKTGQVRVIGSQIELDPDRSKVVQQVFQMYADGLSIRDIVCYLNEKGIPTLHNKRYLSSGRKRPVWIPNTIRSMLTNEKYIGDWTFNKTGWITNPETGQQKLIDKDRSEWEENNQPDLRIIDQVTWDRVQQRVQSLKRSPQKGKGARSNNLFAGLLKCHVCGGSYVIVTSSDRGNPLFGCCTNKQSGEAACPNGFKVSKNELEKTILPDIQYKLLSPKVVTAIVSKANDSLKLKLSELKKGSPGLRAEYGELQRKIENLLQAIEKGIVSDSLMHRLTVYEARKKELESQLLAADTTYDFSEVRIDESYAKGWLDRLQQLLGTDVIAARAKLVPLIGKLVLTPEMVEGDKYLRVNGEASVLGFLSAVAPEARNNWNYGPPVFRSLENRHR